MDFDFKKLQTETKNYILKNIEKYSTDVSKSHRVLIRFSGTEPLLRILVEAKSREKVETLSNEITCALKVLIQKVCNSL